MEFVYAIRKSNGVMFCMTREDYEKDKDNLEFVKSLSEVEGPVEEPKAPEPVVLTPEVSEDFESAEVLTVAKPDKEPTVKHKKVTRKKVASKE